MFLSNPLDKASGEGECPGTLLLYSTSHSVGSADILTFFIIWPMVSHSEKYNSMGSSKLCVGMFYFIQDYLVHHHISFVDVCHSCFFKMVLPLLTTKV